MDRLPSPWTNGLEDAGGVGRVDAAPLVRHLDAHEVALPGRGDPHVAADGRVAGRVVEQVGEHLRELAVVGVEQWQVVGQIGAHVHLAHHGASAGVAAATSSARSTAWRSGANAPASMRLRLRRFATSRSSRSTSSHTVVSSSWRVASSYSTPSRRSVDDGPHRRERRAQVVGDRAEQRRALAVECLELLRTRGLACELGPLALQLDHVLVELAYLALSDGSPGSRRWTMPETSRPTSDRHHDERDELNAPCRHRRSSSVPYGSMKPRLRVSAAASRGDDRRRCAADDGRADDDHHEERARRWPTSGADARGQEHEADEHARRDAEHDPQPGRGPGARESAHPGILTRSLRPVRRP